MQHRRAEPGLHADVVGGGLKGRVLAIAGGGDESTAERLGAAAVEDDEVRAAHQPHERGGIDSLWPAVLDPQQRVISGELQVGVAGKVHEPSAGERVHELLGLGLLDQGARGLGPIEERVHAFPLLLGLLQVEVCAGWVCGDEHDACH